MAKDYKNLGKVAANLIGVGSLFKLLAALLALGGVIVGLGSERERFFYVGVLVVVGVWLWAAGLLLAAAGEALDALRDLAVNSEKTANALTSTTKDAGSVPVTKSS